MDIPDAPRSHLTIFNDAAIASMRISAAAWMVTDISNVFLSNPDTVGLFLGVTTASSLLLAHSGRKLGYAWQESKELAITGAAAGVVACAGAIQFAHYLQGRYL